MALFEHFRYFGTEAQCTVALEHKRHPTGFLSPCWRVIHISC